jgi:hypothetical protein
MNDWLALLTETNAPLSVALVAARLTSAALFGAFVCFVYFISFGRRKVDAIPFAVTLVLLSVLVAMTTLIIGNNQALAFSLVGTLAIVRFRTTMDDTRDTAFVIFAVAVGMGSAVGALLVVIVGVPIVTFVVIVSTLIASRIPPVGPERLVCVKLSTQQNDPAGLGPILDRFATRWHMAACETAKSADAVEYQYAVRFPNADWLPVIAALKAHPGVVTVEVKGKG